MMMRWVLGISAVFLFVSCVLPAQAGTQAGANRARKEALSKTGFLLAAPDRGFTGNDRVRQAFKSISAMPEQYPSRLVFITDQDSAKYVDQALARLTAEGVKKLVVLPLFLSRANPRFALLKTFVNAAQPAMAVQYARAFGDSYLAVEMLAARLKRVNGADLVIIAGNGAKDGKSRKQMSQDLTRIAHQARQGVFMGKIKTIVWPVRGAQGYEDINHESWQHVRESKGRVQLVPFHMGRELDSMMSFNAALKAQLPDGMTLLPTGEDERDWISLWMQREVNRYTALERGSVGIVVNAHGADFHWNQTMRDASRDLALKYPVEYAFSMGDPPSLRTAVNRLEAKGVGAIVIVRVFGMASSFRRSTEHLTGQDAETPLASMARPSHGSMHGHMGMAYVPRLRTASMVVTTGGLQDDPLFASALLDRAWAISKNPAKETVILVGHGKGDDQANEAWLDVLASISAQMKRNGGDQFRDILYQTWREDWKDKRSNRIASVQDMVRAAAKDGGIALVIPARTTGRGPVDRFLKGLDYRAGTGFAPHKLFSQWLEQQVSKGVAILRQSRHPIMVKHKALHDDS